MLKEKNYTIFTFSFDFNLIINFNYFLKTQIHYEIGVYVPNYGFRISILFAHFLK